MLLTKLYNKIPEEYKEDFAVGLVGGLVIGLAFGLVFGLVVGLVVGLVFGLVFGLAVGLVVCLVFGLVFGLVVGLVLGLLELLSSIQQIFIVLILILVISEVFYWLDKHRWNEFGRWGNTLAKKSEALFETSLIVVNICNLFNHGGEFIGYFSDKGDELHMVLSVVGYGTVVVLVIVGYVWLNSLKFKDKGKKP